MSAMQAGLVKKLSQRSPEWRVTVRLTRIWANKTRETKKIYELGLLFIDREGNMIEGYIPENRIEEFGTRIKEGLVYKLDSYQVTPARTRYKTVQHAYRIRFSHQTSMEEIDPAPQNFPMYAYSTKPFAILANRIGDTSLLSDVVGVAYRMTDIIPPKKENNDPRRQIYVKDERSGIVTLWGEHAETFNAESLYEASLDNNIPVLFMGMVVDDFRGLGFRSTYMTRWIINPPIPESDALRESLQGERIIIEWEGHDLPAVQQTEATLASLGSQRTKDIVRKRFNLRVQITEIIKPEDWWFYACKNCWKKMELAGNIRKCPICGKTEEEQRYKLSVKAKDVHNTDDTNQVIAEFLFLGDTGVDLTGRKANLLASQVGGRANYIPPAIASVVGQKYAITAEVRQDTYDANPGQINFKVISVELITSPPPTPPPSEHSNPPAGSETPAPTDITADSQHQHEQDSTLEPTPVKDVIDPAEIDTNEEKAPNTTDRKRKGKLTGDQTLKKGTNSGNRGTAKTLFPPNQQVQLDQTPR